MNIFDSIKMIYSILYRKRVSPKRYKELRETKYKDVLMPKLWETIRDKTPQEFSDFINQYKYRRDSNNGKFDNTIQEPNFFFVKRENDRDCDDFTRMWYWYFQRNKDYKQVYEIFLYGKQNIDKTCHMTCFVKNKSDKFQVIDYRYDSTEYNSLQECVNFVAKKFNHKGYTVWGVYNTHKK